MSGWRNPAAAFALSCLLLGSLAYPGASAQTNNERRPESAASFPTADHASTDVATELRTGADLTRRGLLREAIPHLLAAQQLGADSFSAAFDLGICYLGMGNYKEAIAVLAPLHAATSRTPAVDNLLAQAYLGDGQAQAALSAFTEAAAASPKDEKLYAYMADACTDHQNYAMGLQVAGLGLRQLPDSARLHYEHALFLARLGRFEEGKPEFVRAAQLAPDSYIGYLAEVQKDLYEDDLAGATQVLRHAIQSGHRDYQMLSLLGTVLLHNGAAPGEPEFAEAEKALDQSAEENPGYSATQIALGKIYLMENQPQKAAEHLEIGRRLEPDNPAVYASLASAYDQLGEHSQARLMRQQIGRLLAEKSPGGPAPQQP
ncbi:MAG: tetratricopeptide repeat protein [Acidobacteriaceae bacterium]